MHLNTNKICVKSILKFEENVTRTVSAKKTQNKSQKLKVISTDKKIQSIEGQACSFVVVGSIRRLSIINYLEIVRPRLKPNYFVSLVQIEHIKNSILMHAGTVLSLYIDISPPVQMRILAGENKRKQTKTVIIHSSLLQY